jgi:integrase
MSLQSPGAGSYLESVVELDCANESSTEIIWLEFRSAEGNTVWSPVITTDGAVVHYPSAWLLSAALDNFSPSTLQRRAVALQKFAQYFAVYPLPSQTNVAAQNYRRTSAMAVLAFQNALNRGSIRLGWKSMPLHQARINRKWFDMFCDWLVDNSGFDPKLHPNPLVARAKSEHYSVTEHRIQRDILGHLYTATLAAREPKTRAIGQHVPAWSAQRYSSIKAQCETALQSVRAKPPMISLADYYKLLAITHERKDWRGECLWLLLGAGCARVSEVLNIFATDVFMDTEGEAYVALANPVEGMVEYQGKWIMRNRYLHDRFGCISRALLPVMDPLRAGWKGMAIGGIEVPEVPEIQLWAQRGWATIEWLFPFFGKQFGNAWTHYRLQLQKSGVALKHPYAFVNLRGNIGAPLTRQNVSQLLDVACRRAGIIQRRPHRLRHMYGGTCAELGLSLNDTQARMRHRSWLSTLVYYQISASAARRRMKEVGRSTFAERQARMRELGRAFAPD